jgi:hypothetical protein
MLFQHAITLGCSPELLAEHIMSPRLFIYVSRPVIKFKAVDPVSVPEKWKEEHYVVNMQLFGALPIGRHHINISFKNRSGEKGKFWFELRDNGSGTFISKWDHTIIVHKTSDGCLYRDHVEIKAGLFTPVVWAFASLFYRHRQRRLRQLAASGFSFTALPG